MFQSNVIKCELHIRCTIVWSAVRGNTTEIGVKYAMYLDIMERTDNIGKYMFSLMNLKFYSIINGDLSHGSFYFCFWRANNASGYINI